MTTSAITIDENDFENWSDSLTKANNLDELFGINTVGNNYSNETLKYQPVKETDTQHNNATPAAKATKTSYGSSWSTLLAKVVRAYKHNESLGKVGVAVLKNTEEACAKIILYKSKTHLLANCSLDNNAAVAASIYKQNGYLQFYDDENIYWSIHFDKPSDEAEFIAKLQDQQVLVKESSELSPISTSSITTADPEVEFGKKSSKIKKPTLIERMAKMGQQLPTLASTVKTASNESTSDDADESLETIATPISKLIPQAQAAQILLPLNVNNNRNSSTPNTGNAINLYSAAPANTMEAQLMQMLLSENRTQNTEVRVNLSKLEMKLEQLGNNLETYGRNVTSVRQTTDKEDELLELETKLLDLKKENRKLRQSMEIRQENVQRQLLIDLRSHEQQLAEFDITLNANTDMTCLFTQLLQKTQTFQTKILEIQTQNTQLQEELKGEKAKAIEEQQNTVDTLSKLSNTEKQISKLQTSLQGKDTHILELQSKLLEQQKLHNEKLEQQKLQIGGTVKAIMNNLYVDLTDQIVSQEHLQKDELLTLIGKCIKEETLKVIE